MNYSTVNWVRLWWHCLTHFHRAVWVDKLMLNDKYYKTNVECFDCDYGKDKGGFNG